MTGVNQSIISGSMIGTPRGKFEDNRHSNIGAGDQQKLGNQKQFDAAVAFIIQNEKEVIPWKKKTPISTSDLNQFVAVKFVTKIVGGPQGHLGGPALNRLASNQLRSQV